MKKYIKTALFSIVFLLVILTCVSYAFMGEGRFFTNEPVTLFLLGIAFLAAAHYVRKLTPSS